MASRTSDPTRIHGTYCPDCEMFQPEWVEVDLPMACPRCGHGDVRYALLVLETDRYFKRFSQRARVK